MHLAVGPFSGFTGLLQLLLMILGVFLTTAFVITLIMHYRRRKKELEPEAVQQIIAALPEGTGYKIDDEYVLIDHSGLIRDYKSRLLQNEARYTALKQDFNKLETRYNNLLKNNSPTQPEKNSNMNPIQEQHSQDENTKAVQLREELELVKQQCLLLEQEKSKLLEKISLIPAVEDTQLLLLEKLREENRDLKAKLSEQEVSTDMVTDMRSQLGFLQQQLEQRIRNYHLASQEANHKAEQLETLKIELEQRREETMKLHSEIIGKSDELQLKADQLVYFENTLQELQKQNELLNAEAADYRERAESLQKILEMEQSKTLATEQKLVANKQLLQKLYQEFSNCMKDESEVEPPVINLHPAYISPLSREEWDESAVH